MTRKKRLTKKEIKYIVGLILALLGVYTIQGDGRIIDGDTLKIGTERIRLEGIDAPESDQTCSCGGRKVMCGREATRALSAFIGTDEVACRAVERDNYGRLIGECFVTRDGREISLNRWMVANGHALAYTQYSMKFADAEAEAKRAKRGVWACSFSKPWDYRREKRQRRH